jgi:protein kinase C substrate 80K-H
LKDTCVEKDSGEYTYEHCFLAHTTQKSKKGGGNTGMGNFAHMTSVTVDEELPVDGKGLGSGERIALKYENGQHCWNGPNRSTLVVLACAEKDEIWKIVEEEKCVYRMEVGTPAVCGVEVQKAPVEHDEL